MKIEIDDRPAKGPSLHDYARDLFYAIRLYPETVEEVKQLERPFVCKLKATKFKKCDAGHFVMLFEEEK